MTTTGFKNWDELEEYNRKRSAIITGTIVAIVFLLFLWLGLFRPDPPPAAEGILVDFGETTIGLGNIEASNSSAPPPPTPQPQPQETEVTETQEVEESVTIPDEVEKAPTPVELESEPVQPEPEPEPPQPDPDALFDPSQFNFGESGSEGNTQTGGNMGDPSGGESDNYLGQNSGLGDVGIASGLGGWGLSSIDLDNSHREAGVVMVQVELDDNGNVVSAKFVRRGSTIIDPAVYNQLIRDCQRTGKFKALGSSRQNVGIIKINLTIQ